MTDRSWEDTKRVRLRARIKDGELVFKSSTEVKCPLCGDNCGQCGNTDLYDPAVVKDVFARMPPHIQAAVSTRLIVTDPRLWIGVLLVLCGFGMIASAPLI